MFKSIIKIIFLLCNSLMIAAAYAMPAQSIGDVADDAMAPVGVFNSFVSTGSLMIGSCFLLASFFKYNQYRTNPLATPISTVIMLFVFGIILVLLPYTSYLIGLDL